MSDRSGALAEVTGGLCYGLLRTFQATARACTSAPSPALAERQAGFAHDELDRFRVLRARLNALTGDPESALMAFRATLDAFYDAAGTDDWLDAQVFHYVGDTITSDFVEFLSARVDADTADALRASLTGRSEQEAFALEQIEAALAREGAVAQERIGRFARSLVGAALNRLRDALFESDALERLLGAGGVKELVLELLGRHRERLERLGLDTLE
jgi:hypothetical protein